jgi:3-oxoacyl-[acyl-carrier protein] reductase
MPSLAPAFSLAGRSALVCGASAGIGRATALACAGLGAGITALARDGAKLEALLPELRAAGAASATSLVADLENIEGFERVVGDWLQQAAPVHILVHNTGGPPAGKLVEADTAALLAAFRRHVLSAHRLVQLLLPGMREAGYGRIVNVLSTSVREPIDLLGVSNTIRAAMASWAKSLSRELPPGVTINNVLPGYTATERLAELARSTAARTGRSIEAIEAEWREMAPEKRLGRPEEIAAAIAFLVSPAASFVRGTSLPVDGGRLRSI